MASKKTFDKRLKRLERRHNRMANGVVKTVNSDGLIVVKPRLYRPMFPLKGLMAILFLGFSFKGFLLASLGQEAYAEKVAELQTGSVMEQVGAWVMQPDPVTVVVAQGFEQILAQQTAE